MHLLMMPAVVNGSLRCRSGVGQAERRQSQTCVMRPLGTCLACATCFTLKRKSTFTALLGLKVGVL